VVPVYDRTFAGDRRRGEQQDRKPIRVNKRFMNISSAVASYAADVPAATLLNQT